MKSVTTYGKIDENGKLHIYRREALNEALRSFKPGRVEVTVKRVYGRRSVMQNAYLHGVVFPMVCEAMHEAGWSKADINPQWVKDYLKHHFLQAETVNDQTGEVMKYIRHTADLDKADFSEFVEQCRQWAAEYLNIDIPSPGEQMEIFTINKQ